MRTEGAGVSSGAPGARLLLRTDGASRGNPGPAAAGIVIESADGTLLAEGETTHIVTDANLSRRALPEPYLEAFRKSVRST